MNTTLSPLSARYYAKLAGLLYLMIIITGIFSEGIVRSSLIIAGDAGATVHNISESEGLFRLGFLSDLIMVISDIGVALLFYVLLRPVNKYLALLAAIFRLIQATILGFNLLYYLQPLLLLSGADYLVAFDQDQLAAMVQLALVKHSFGYLLSGIFFGLCCLVLGYLFFRSEQFPNLFGGLLCIAGVAYLLESLSAFLLPDYAAITEILVIVSAIGVELSLTIWLLVRGSRQLI